MEEVKYNSTELIDLLSTFYFYCWFVNNGIPFKKIDKEFKKSDLLTGEVDKDPIIREHNEQTVTSISEYFEHSREQLYEDLEKMYVYDFDLPIMNVEAMLKGYEELKPKDKELRYDKQYTIEDFKSYLQNKEALRDYFHFADLESLLKQFVFFYEESLKTNYSVIVLLEQADVSREKLKNIYQYWKRKVQKNTENEDSLDKSPYLETYLKKLEKEIELCSIDGNMVFTNIRESDFGNPKLEDENFKELYSNLCEYLSIKSYSSQVEDLEILVEDFSQNTGLKSFYEWMTRMLQLPNQFESLGRTSKAKEPRTSIAFQYVLFDKLGLIDKIRNQNIQSTEKHKIIAKILGSKPDSAKRLFNNTYPNLENTQQEVEEFLKDNHLTIH